MVNFVTKRDVQGKFVLKNDDYRSVRSLRLTDSTWSVLGASAESLGITKADLLEQIVRQNGDLLPGNTRLNENYQPSNIRQEQEIERLSAEVQHLHQENALLLKRLTVGFLQRADLEALRAQTLKELKLGRQAPGYKIAQKALERFITHLIERDKYDVF